MANRFTLREGQFRKVTYMPVELSITGGDTPKVGGIYYVDSVTGSNAASRGTVDLPLASIEYAFGNYCVANNGDYVYAFPGHVESISTAGGLDLDVAGVWVEALGIGNDRAQIVFTGTTDTADIDVDAADIALKNFLIDVTGNDSLDAPLDVNAARFKFYGNTVILADAAGQADAFMVLATGASGLKVLGNEFQGSSDPGLNSAISIVGTPDDIEIAYNTIYGDFADACIHNAIGNIATRLNIHDNYLENFQAADHAIELVSACTGRIADNHLAGTDLTALLDPGSCQVFNNLGYDSNLAGDAEGVLLFAQQDSGANVLGSDNANNAFASTNVVANADGTVIEREEYIQASIAVPGADSATNTLERDVVGNKADATAAGAVTATDTLVAYIKQIVTMLGIDADTNAIAAMLGGAAGIATMPNAAVPANAVNVFELLREIWAVLNGTAAGENGVQVWPAAAAPANNVSLAEAVRYVVETLLSVPTADLATNLLTTQVLGNKADAAATGAVTATDTLVAYIKQLITMMGTDADTNPIAAMLSGANGIGIMPSAAVPANNVNAFELLREIWAVLNGTAAGENGVQVWAAAAAPANNVSIAEAIRYVVESQLNVPTADLATNALTTQVVGNKTDAAIADTIEGGAATTQTLHALAKTILQRLGADSGNNTAATTLVVANRDGSILERLEYQHAQIETTVTRATAALPQTAAAAIFTITGVVEIRRIVGYVTTVVGAIANATKLVGNSTGGGASTDLCATLDINAHAVDSRYEITGVFANAMVRTLDVPLAVVQTVNVVVGPGTIDLNCAGSDGGTGRVRWSCTYMPLEAGATVVAAA